MIENIDASKCTGCGICVDVCPLDTLRLNPFTKRTPPCQLACPAGVDIRGFINYIKQDMLEASARLLDQALPYPSIVGRLCTYPCEKACARKKVDDPLNIHRLEEYLGDYLLSQQPEPVNFRHALKVAVIGSGPVGLAAAHYLCWLGYMVTIFEKKGQIGGSFLREVNAGRLKGEILDAEIQRLKKMGVTFTVNTGLSKDFGFVEIADLRFGAVFMAPGVNSDALSMHALEGMDSVFFKKVILSKRVPLIKAIASAKTAANRIDRQLQRQDAEEMQGDKPDRAVNIPRTGIKPEPRLEEDNGFDDNTAEKEALRCMSCGSLAYIAYPEDCMTCYDCEVQCPADAIKVHPFKEVLPLSLALDK